MGFFFCGGGGSSDANDDSFAAIQVSSTAETDPVPDGGDAADDPAIWVHPADPGLSVIIGTNKLGGIAVYALNGTELQYLPSGQINNVDIRYGFPFAGKSIDLIAADDRSDDTIRLYTINSATRKLSEIGSFPTNITVYGLCMYHSAMDDEFYVFVNSDTGEVRQYRVYDNAGIIAGSLERSFSVGSITEGCVADDLTGDFYIGEEDEAIWKYGAEPGDGNSRSAIDTVAGGRLTADIEGLTIYYGPNDQGYLIASSQGSSKFVIYNRFDGSHVGTFQIVAGNNIDAVTGTDGIDVISTPLGASFPFGVFVAQDNDNTGANQNFKLVRWQDIAQGFSVDLLTETGWDPRD
jgi:3-phytase